MIIETEFYPPRLADPVDDIMSPHLRLRYAYWVPPTDWPIQFVPFISEFEGSELMWRIYTEFSGWM